MTGRPVVLVVVLLAGLIPAASNAQQLTLRGADSLWARNYARNDTATAAKLMADDFAMTSSNGRVKTKSEEMADVRATPGLIDHYFRTRDVTAEELGNTGLVAGTAEWSYTANGRRTDVSRAYNAVYRRGGALGWQLVALYIRPAPGSSSLAPLKWIEGTWQGTGDGVQPFYERYRLQDDTTLVVESFADATLSKISDTTRFESRRGLIANPGNARYVAQLISADSIVFIPLRGVGNSFVWRRGTADHWSATIRWPAHANQPARERPYTMLRR